MSARNLRGSLARLRTEVERYSPADDSARRDLELLLTRLESHLGLPGQPPAPTALLDSVRGAIRRFEVAHPALTASLAQVLNTLGATGI